MEVLEYLEQPASTRRQPHRERVARSALFAMTWEADDEL